MESESGADIGQLEVPELDPPLLVFPEPLLEGGNPPFPACGMVNSQVPHHGLDGRVIGSQKLIKFFVDDLVRDNECCLVTVYGQPW